MQDIINCMYQNASMGILGINEVLYKIQNKKLYKVIQKEKREYEKMLRKIKKLSKDNNISLTEINLVAKLSSELLSQIKLIKEGTDETIIEMMIDGTNKSISFLNGKSKNIKDKQVLKTYNQFINLLNDNIKELEAI